MKGIIIKYLTIMLGGFLAVIEKSMAFLIPALLIIFVDVITAYMLSRRAHKQYPTKAQGKFRSDYKGRILMTFCLFFCAIILGAYVDLLVLRTTNSDIAVRFVMGAFIFYEVWSILENLSSCNGKKWAKMLQRIMVDKTERHFDVELTEIKPTKRNGKKRIQKKSNR